MATDKDRPLFFNISIQGGMIESLGVNMYTSVAKSLVEFVANAYDSDAKKVTISLPYNKIQEEKIKIRAKIKTKSIPRREILDIKLPENLEITIEDDGHGMLPSDIQNKFLPINRNRRKGDAQDSNNEMYNMSENGIRRVTGRKGLGKLAGFGTAEKITVETKKKEENFSTTFCLDCKELAKAEDITDKKITADHQENQPLESHGTKITLSNLNYGSLVSSMSMIKKTIINNFFGITKENFAIYVKNTDIPSESTDPLSPEETLYEFCYPNSDGKLKKDTIDIDDIGQIEFEYTIKFRYRKGDDENIEKQGWKVGSLPTNQRGARIYCNNRLAMGPSLLGLHTGVTNYLAHSYMECIVKADVLDQEFKDLINTNRTELKENPVTEAFSKEITDRMKKALTANGQYRKKKAKEIIEKSDIIREYGYIIKKMNPKEKKLCMKILEMLVEDFGIGSENFQKFVPSILGSESPMDILNRKSWIPSSVGNIVPDERHRERQIFNELSQSSTLDATKARNATAVLARTFIEISVEYYMGKNNIKNTNKNGGSLSLPKRINAVTEHMKFYRGEKPNVEIGIRQGLNLTNKSICEIEKLNYLVHSNYYEPLLEDLEKLWNNCEKFIINCWTL